MSINTEIDAVRSAARLFFDAMLEWEHWSAALGPHNDASNPVRLAKLTSIFEKHLSAKALGRGQTRYACLSFDEPSEFAGAIQNIEPADKDTIWVYIPWGVIGGSARYLLQPEDGQWKVDYRELDIANKGKWVKEVHL